MYDHEQGKRTTNKVNSNRWHWHKHQMKEKATFCDKIGDSQLCPKNASISCGKLFSTRSILTAHLEIYCGRLVRVAATSIRLGLKRLRSNLPGRLLSSI